MTIARLFKNPIAATEAVVEVLIEAGIEMVFGISGGHTGKIYTALGRRQSEIRTVLVREESLAAVMAEMYGRLKGRPGVILGQGPWVLGNGLLGTIEALLSSSPMVLLTDVSDTAHFSMHGAYQTGTGDYGGWDARQAFGGVTKRVIEAREPAEAVRATQLALKHAMAGQPGPVALLFHGASLDGSVGPDTTPRLYPTRHFLESSVSRCAPMQAIQEAARLIEGANKPVIIAGNGVRISQAYASLQSMAEHLHAPVVSTPSGKGVFPETHELALGVFGTFGTAAANACVAESDLVLVVGSKLTASDTALENPELLNPERQVFVQIDAEPLNAGWTFPAAKVLIGDAQLTLEALRGVTAPSNRADRGRVARHRGQYGYFSAPEYSADDAPLLPQRIIHSLMTQLPEQAIVTCDAGENRIFMTHFYQTRQAGGFLQAAGAGPMGYGIPSALAAKLIHPERPVVAVVGDGGFAMTMNGLLTAVEQDIPIVVVIFSNQALGWSLHSRGPFAARFQDFNFAAIAAAMGCESVRVHDAEQLQRALATAHPRTRPLVIDVATSLKTTYLDVTSPLAKGGFGGGAITAPSSGVH